MDETFAWLGWTSRSGYQEYLQDLGALDQPRKKYFFYKLFKSLRYIFAVFTC